MTSPLPSPHSVDFLLQRAYPILFEICPLTMRTQGILLVRDVIMLLNGLPVDGERYAPPLRLVPVEVQL